MHHSHHLNRRSFLRTTGAIAAATVAGPAIAQDNGGATIKLLANGRRKLGKIEVSSIGLGCQDMTGAVYASAPNRADTIAIARAAHDRGVTFFDAAEAYSSRTLGGSDSRHEQTSASDRGSGRRHRSFHARGTPGFNAALARTPVQGARMGRGILSLSGGEAPPKQ